MIRQIEKGLRRHLFCQYPRNYRPLFTGGALISTLKCGGYSSLGLKSASLLQSSAIPKNPMIIPNRTYISIPSTPSNPHNNETDGNEPTKEPPKTLKERLTHFFRQYGKFGIAIYFSVSGITFGSIYLALRSGIDVPGLLMKMGVQEREWMKNAGTVALAYAIYKLMLPLRLAVVVWLTRSIAKRFGNKLLTKGK